jgi:protein-S-isoprenylcysteine O-methyltransferase Ste14
MGSPIIPVIVGTAMVICGEMVRLWAVRHIGTISRTRGDRLGPLVSSGPFAFVRNPLYLGNVALWTGFTMAARLLWLVPIVIVVLSLEYHAIVRWEEDLLTARRGDDYRTYAARVPRWIPSLRSSGTAPAPSLHSWRETFFSERGTLLSIGGGFLLLWIKSQL